MPGRGVTALDGVDLTIDRGETFGLLGPNGAGKSTLIDLALGLATPTRGSVRVLDDPMHPDAVAIRRRMGVLPEEAAAIGERTGREHLRFAIELKESEDSTAELLERVGMREYADRPVSAYSTGMRRRVFLAMALAGDPALLILDEPTSGLDPTGAKSMREIIRQEAARGATVIFSSHILEQVEAVCDRIAILQRGQIVAVDSIEALQRDRAADATVTVRLATIPGRLQDALAGRDEVSRVSVDEPLLTIQCAPPGKARVLETIFEADTTVEDVTISEPSLAELFDQYAGDD